MVTPQVIEPDVDDADDEAITDLLAAVIAEAGALLRQRRTGYRAATKPALRRLAGYAAEALSAAGAGPVGIVAAPEPAEDTPPITLADDRDTRQVQFLEAGAALVRQMPYSGLNIEVRATAHLMVHVDTPDGRGTEDGERANLNAISQLFGRLGGQPRISAGVTTGQKLHVAIEGTWIGVPILANTLIAPGPTQDTARAWLDKLGVEVRA